MPGLLSLFAILIYCDGTDQHWCWCCNSGRKKNLALGHLVLGHITEFLLQPSDESFRLLVLDPDVKIGLFVCLFYTQLAQFFQLHS